MNLLFVLLQASTDLQPAETTEFTDRVTTVLKLLLESSPGIGIVTFSMIGLIAWLIGKSILNMEHHSHRSLEIAGLKFGTLAVIVWLVCMYLYFNTAIGVDHTNAILVAVKQNLGPNWPKAFTPFIFTFCCYVAGRHPEGFWDLWSKVIAGLIFLIQVIFFSGITSF